MILKKKVIKIVDVTGKSAAQIETTFNDNFGNIGWRIIQVVVLNGTPFIILERDI